MGLQQVAVGGHTGEESLDYVGYSMGTMQMYYLLAMASEDDALYATTSKVDKFLAITPCAYAYLFVEGGEDIQVRRDYIQGYIDLSDSLDVDFLHGKDADVDKVLELACYGQPDEVCAGI